MPRVFVTTSWDDEDRSGLKVADVLSRHGLSGTFYVPTGRLGRHPFFTATDLRTLSVAGFEIGAHTVSHAILTEVGSEELMHEVGDCKAALQQILGTEVTMFCYPKGRFNAEVVSAVEHAGYHGARGTRMLDSGTAFDRFAMPTTVQAYPHRRANYLRNLIRLGAFGDLLGSVPDLIGFDGWLALGKKRFDRVMRQGGIWHLYGHPWEIEKLGLWEQFGEMLQYVSNRSGVEYVTNGQLLELVMGSVSGKTRLAKAEPQSAITRGR
ncbi:MAG: polysaccharide deacetylase family protein [Candidatus Sulfotelmatobacter sp.]